MKAILISILLCFATYGWGQSSPRCGHIKADGIPCKMVVSVQGQKCHHHGGEHKVKKLKAEQCKGTTVKGQRCKKSGTYDGYCNNHKNK